MKTPQVAPLPGMSPLGLLRHHVTGAIERGEKEAIVERPAGLTNPRNVDEKTVAERKWTAPLKPKAEQKACDLGLFSDDSKQSELF